MIIISTGCSKDYLEIYTGTNLVSDKIVIFSKFQEDGLQTPGGRFCSNSARGRNLTMSISADTIILYFHTDGSGNGRNGLHFNFTAVGKCMIFNCSVCTCSELKFQREFLLSLSLLCFLFPSVDVNECLDIERTSTDCHHCTNLPGGFVCDCRDGYYHSAAAQTCYGECMTLLCSVQAHNIV